jgi:hypothetical protein
MRKFVSHRLGVLLAVLSAVVLAGFVVPGTANAAGGGCRAWSDDSSSLQACISNEGRTAYGDTYLDRVSDRCLGIRVAIVDPDDIVVSEEKSYDCATGHKGPVTYSMVSTVHYQTRVCIDFHQGLACKTSKEGWY